MILKAIVDDQVYTLNVPDPVVADGEELFARLDSDMDKGWQMSRDWVDAPDRLQRCQIVADKLLSALENENQKLGVMMAGYILSRLPDVESVEMDLHGEIQNTQFRFRDETPADSDAVSAAATGAASAPAAGMSKMEAMTQAGNDVTKVFRVGKGWRFSVFDHASGTWQDGPLLATEQEAERLRQEAFKARYEALQRGG